MNHQAISSSTRGAERAQVSEGAPKYSQSSSMSPPNAVNCIKGEIHNVLSVMRLNQRWASEARFRKEIPLQSETPLLRSFKTLHNYLQRLVDINDVDTVFYLQPFLDVIASKDTSGPLTEMALSAVNKFLLYGFVHPQAPRCREAVNKIAEAATQCRFESSSSTDDEATLMKLLELLVNCLRSVAGPLLTDERVWQVTVCCFRIANIDRASYLLQKNAESTLTHVILTVFSRIDDLEDTIGESETDLLREAESHVMSGEQRGGSIAEHASTDKEGVSPRAEHDDRQQSCEADSQQSDSDYGHPSTRSARSSSLTVGHVRGNTRHPYGSCVLTKMLSWLSRMTDPSQNTKYTRIVGLRLINIALETAGASLAKFSSIVKVVQTELCKFLVQNSREEELTVLSPTLRVVFNLFNSLKEHLKVQLEVFFTSVHLYLADSTTARPEQKELALESLLEFCREPALMLDLYINYDCDVACTNLFETLCRCLCRNAVPENGPLTSLHVLSLEGVLAVVENMARRCAIAARMANSESQQPEEESSTAGEELPLEQLRQQKHLKKRMGLAATRFNREGIRHNNWIPYVQDINLLPIPSTPDSVANFFRECTGLDSTIIGDYLSQPDDEKHAFHTAVRKAYLSTFSFTDRGIDDALREFLGCFRLPGEAQKIERLMSAFAEKYFAQQEETPLKNEDTAFILSYSIIMLQTDLHNPQVSRKMTEEEFIKNNRGINDGADLPREYLQNIYRSVQKNGIELKTNSSSLNKHNATEVSAAWDGILAREDAVSAFTSTAPLGKSLRSDSAGIVDDTDQSDNYTTQWIQSAALHEKDMFALVADATLGAISFVWENTTDEAVLRKTMLGWRHAATIASYHKMDNTLNSIVISLCKFFKKTVENTMELSRSDLPSDKVTLGPLDGFLYHDMDKSKEEDGVDESTSTPYGSASFNAQVNGTAQRNESREGVGDSGNHTPGSMTGSISDNEMQVLEHSASNPTLLELRRCLMTLRCIFTLSNLFASKIQEGWRSVVDVTLSLYRLESFPEGILDLDDIRAPNGAPLPSLYHQDTRVAIHESQYQHLQRSERSDDTSRVDWCTPLSKQVHQAKEAADALGLRSGLITNLASLLWREDDQSGGSNSVVVASLYHEALVAGVENLMKVIPTAMDDPSFTQLLKSLLLSRDPLSTSPDELNEAVVSLELFTLVALRNSKRIHISLPLLQSHIKRILAKKESRIFPSREELDEVMQGLIRSRKSEIRDATFYHGARVCNCWDDAPGTVDNVLHMPFTWSVILAGSHQNNGLLYNLILKRQVGILTERAVVDMLRLVLRAQMEEGGGNICDTSDAVSDSSEAVSRQVYTGLRMLLNIPDEIFTLLSPRIAAGVNLLIRAASTYEEPSGGSTEPELSSQWELLWGVLDSCMSHFYSTPAVVDALAHISRVKNISYSCFYYMHSLNSKLALMDVPPVTLNSVGAAHLITQGGNKEYGVNDIGHHEDHEGSKEHGFSLASASPANYYVSLSVAARGMSSMQSAELVSKSAVELIYPLLTTGGSSDERWLEVLTTLKEAFVTVWTNESEVLKDPKARQCRTRLLGCYISTLQKMTREFMGSITVYAWERAFFSVLHPLIAETSISDPDSDERLNMKWHEIEDIRSTMLSLLTKTFLQVGMEIANDLSIPEGAHEEVEKLFDMFLRLWKLCLSLLVDELCKSYDLMDLNGDTGKFPAGISVVFDSSWENIKNLILVVASEEYFERMNLHIENVRKTFWDAAWEILKQLPPIVLEELSEIIDQVFDVKPVLAETAESKTGIEQHSEPQTQSSNAEPTEGGKNNDKKSEEQLPESYKGSVACVDHRSYADALCTHNGIKNTSVDSEKGSLTRDTVEGCADSPQPQASNGEENKDVSSNLHSHVASTSDDTSAKPLTISEDEAGQCSEGAVKAEEMGENTANQPANVPANAGNASEGEGGNSRSHGEENAHSTSEGSNGSAEVQQEQEPAKDDAHGDATKDSELAEENGEQSTANSGSFVSSWFGIFG
eukprot:gb/GECG01011117.1/.p1 GENE.gb/GECG01011117.1/~~gb/GECG01011117.1/.p1  ORF type:complete len:2015 (+),score=275.06 gb/GECG01011117.1/:1-6045(+)